MECSVTLARFVDFPTPLTPQNVMTNGLLFCLASIASLKISILRFGTKSWTQASSRVFFTVLDIAATSNHVILKYNIKILFMTFQIKLFSSQCKKGFQNFNCQTRTSDSGNYIITVFELFISEKICSRDKNYVI